MVRRAITATTLPARASKHVRPDCVLVGALIHIALSPPIAAVQSAGRSRTTGPSKPERPASIVGKKSPTISAQFTASLSVLIKKMLACRAHFVRCIKPNVLQAPNNFQVPFVADQLRYTGMLETCRIRREGFSYRPTFQEFMARFGLIAFGPQHDSADGRTCTVVLKTAGIDACVSGGARGARGPGAARAPRPGVP